MISRWQQTSLKIWNKEIVRVRPATNQQVAMSLPGRGKRPAHLVFEQGLHVGGTYRVWVAVETTFGVSLRERGHREAESTWNPLPVPLPVSPEDVADAALAEAVAALRLAGLTQDQPAGLAAVLGLRRLHKVVPEAPVERQEPCRDAWRQRVTQSDAP